MNKILTAALAALFLASGAAAKTERILRAGDVILLEEGETLTKHKLRKKLRRYGYTNIGPGSHRGHIISITAYALDKNRYELRVHWKTGEVTRAGRPRNFWY